MISLPVYVHCSSLVKAHFHRSLGDHLSRIIRAVPIFINVSRKKFTLPQTPKLDSRRLSNVALAPYDLRLLRLSRIVVPVASWNLAYHALASQIPLYYPGRRPGRRPASELDSAWLATLQLASRSATSSLAGRRPASECKRTSSRAGSLERNGIWLFIYCPCM